MAVTRSFICCLLYWTAINGLGECGRNEITDVANEEKGKGKKSGEFLPLQLSGYVTALRYDGRPPVNKYLYNTPGQPTEDLVTYGSTMVISSPKVAAISRGLKGVDNLQGSTYMKTYSETESPTATLRQSSAEKDSSKTTKRSTTRKKRVIDSQRMFRYRKQFPSLPHQETSANLSENPPSYADEETGGNRKKKNKHGRGNRNRKQGGRKKTSVMESGQTLEEELIMVGSNKGGRMKGKSRKLKPATSRDGQSNRRLRQHMQHKKKVKQFLQKRIQEQIAQRRHRRGTPA